MSNNPKPMSARELRRSMSKQKKKVGQIRGIGQGMHQMLDALKQIQEAQPDLVNAEELENMQATMDKTDGVLAALGDLEAGIDTALGAIGDDE